MPSRRALFRTCGTGLTLGVAGCLDTGGESPDETTPAESEAGATAGTETTARGTPATATAGPPPEVREVDPAAVGERGVPRSPSVESDTYEPFRAFVVGERPDSPGNFYRTPHVWVWNLTGEATTIELALTTGGERLRRVETEFPGGQPLAFVFRDRGRYELAVRVGDRTKTVTVERDRFRCNATGTDVQVRPDRIETETVSTSMACTTTPGGS
ncbi:hypothetical protein [Halorussus sp. MSC15.2]|uniref:hypothetical protein n=1 Tax=Halorussus sp. MSC15.2 TaxID=2283638 RepID=UPI0013D3A0E4|nr:hypothetical protein [Halorussus sp. MSC15.2]NEU55725.1 hypothetical protein [Halorussus sp. MSC15.2]